MLVYGHFVHSTNDTPIFFAFCVSCIYTLIKGAKVCAECTPNMERVITSQLCRKQPGKTIAMKRYSMATKPIRTSDTSNQDQVIPSPHCSNCPCRICLIIHPLQIVIILQRVDEITSSCQDLKYNQETYFFQKPVLRHRFLPSPGDIHYCTSSFFLRKLIAFYSRVLHKLAISNRLSESLFTVP